MIAPVNSQILKILENLAIVDSYAESEILKAELLRDSPPIFKVTPANVDEVIARRSQILRAIYPQVLEVQASSQIANSLIPTLWYIWIPLAMHLAEQYQGQPIIQGILGGQGTGKTTMTKFLKLILTEMGFECVNLSLDDLYKTYKEREEIKKLDPEIQWRGVPSTHDLQLGIDTLDQLCSDRSFWEIPRFDKSAHSGGGDRTNPQIIFTKPQIILFEGWFVGIRPVDPDLINSYDFTEESDRQFVLKMNTKLQDYLPLWQKLDSLWLLLPEDYRDSLQWRRSAEHKLTNGMSDGEITKFVHYFWRSLPPEIFITPQRQSADLVIEINSDHGITKLSSPLGLDRSCH